MEQNPNEPVEQQTPQFVQPTPEAQMGEDLGSADNDTLPWPQQLRAGQDPQPYTSPPRRPYSDARVEDTTGGDESSTYQATSEEVPLFQGWSALQPNRNPRRPFPPRGDGEDNDPAKKHRMLD